MIRTIPLVAGSTSAFGQAAIAVFTAIGSLAGLVSLYIWRHSRNMDVTEYVEQIIDARVVQILRETSRVFDGTVIGDGLDPRTDVPMLRELVAGQQRERGETVADLYDRARRLFAWVALGSYGFALNLLIYSYRGQPIQPWPPDVFDASLAVFIVLITWALYHGIRTTNRASELEDELETEAKQYGRSGGSNQHYSRSDEDRSDRDQSARERE